MRLLRGLGGALLWILATVVGIVALIMCATVLLLPLGVPLLGYARRLFAQGGRLMLPRALAHPVGEVRKGTSQLRHRAKESAAEATTQARRAGRRRLGIRHG